MRLGLECYYLIFIKKILLLLCIQRERPAHWDEKIPMSLLWK